jgi:predicted phage terminase large subunit-like protein
MAKNNKKIERKLQSIDEEIEFLLNQQKYVNASNSLYQFLKVGFEHKEVNEFRDSRLAQALCEHLEAVMAGQIKRLIINISPRTMKTLLTGVYFPAYWWLKKPHLQFIYCSYTFGIAKVCSQKFRGLVQHDFYREVQNTMESLVDDPITLIENNENFLLNNYQGSRDTVGISGTITGKGADVIILDDPLKASEAKSKKVNARTNEFIGETLMSRFNRTSQEKVLILIQQRLKEDDTSGFLREMGGFDILELPLLYTGMSNSITKLGFKDWRKKPGEILVPELVTREEVAQMEREMGSLEFERQCQQNVRGAAGNIISNKHFKEYVHSPPYESYVLAADLAESIEDDACYTGIVVFGIYENKYYVVEVIEKKLRFEDQLLEVKNLLTKYPNCRHKLVEKKSMGPALVATLSKEYPGFIALEPKDYGNQKEARLKATIPAFRDGKIYFPTKEKVEKITTLKDQLVTFPLCRNDDVMDAFCYGILWLERNERVVDTTEVMMEVPEHIKERRNIFADTSSPSRSIFSNNRSPSSDFVRSTGRSIFY